MNNKAFEILDFHVIKNDLSNFCINSDTKLEVGKLVPISDYNAVLTLLNATEECCVLYDKYGINGVECFDNIDTVLMKAPKMSILTFSEVIKVKHILRSSRLFYASLNSIPDTEIPHIKALVSALYINQELERSIDKDFISDTEIADTASQTLYEIRIKIRRINDEIKEKLANLTKNENYSRYMQDSIVTLRNGRYVIPVKREYKSMVNGLVHDQSSTGATLFIEPMFIVEANNKLKELMLDESAEIEKILMNYTQIISKICVFLSSNIKIIVECDLNFAKAKYAKSIRAIKPQLNSQGIVSIVDGRHPLIDREVVVPITVRLGGKCNILLITGPNTGGKTVTLKICGLFCIMAMCGLFLPVKEGTNISVFDEIFCDIGDEQSIAQSLSTFSSHIRNIAYILNKSTEKSLLLIDEVGAGTDPEEGGALAIAITEFILEHGFKALITTHYGELKEYSIGKNGIENASMDFNPRTFEPTYHLSIGTPGSSNAIEIANRLNLNKEVIEKAKGFLSKEKRHFENIIRSAENVRFKAEKIKTEVEEQKKEYQTMLDSVKSEQDKFEKMQERLTKNANVISKQIISEATSQAEEIIERMKELLERDITEQTLFEARRMKRELEKIKFRHESNEIDDACEKLTPERVDDLYLNKRVYVKSANQIGTVTKLPNGKNRDIPIQIGNVTINVRINDLYKIGSASQNDTIKSTKKQSIELNTALESEIKVVGMTVDEAVGEIELFVDKAYNQNLNQIKIIHGIGTGRLMIGIHQYLKTNKCVKSFRSGAYGEGNRGVTIVELKQ